MKNISSILVMFVLLSTSVNAQQTLRRFMQPPDVINKIPYGANSNAGHYVQASDAKIYYEVYGQGQPFVILHGGLFGSTIEMSNFIDSLSKKYQVIAISTRGHGKSEVGTEPLTLEQRANDVMAVIKQVTKEKVIILGFSDGGYTAYQLASNFPDQVKKMIVIGAGVLFPGLREFNITAKQAISFDTLYWKQQLSLMPEPDKLEYVFEQVGNCYKHLTVGKELLSLIKCPVLVMAGDRDEGNSVQNVLNAALLIPVHQLSIIPNAGHVCFSDNFQAVWAGMYPFINQTK